MFENDTNVNSIYGFRSTYFLFHTPFLFLDKA